MTEHPEDQHDESFDPDPDMGPEIEPDPDEFDDDPAPTRRGLFGALRKAAQQELIKQADRHLP